MPVGVPSRSGCKMSLQRVALLQQRSARQSITSVMCHQWIAGKYIAVTVEDQRSIPVRWNRNNVVGAIDITLKYVRSAGGDTTVCSSMGNFRGSERQAA